jgi:hypothetical protein
MWFHTAVTQNHQIELAFHSIRSTSIATSVVVDCTFFCFSIEIMCVCRVLRCWSSKESMLGFGTRRSFFGFLFTRNSPSRCAVCGHSMHSSCSMPYIGTGFQNAVWCGMQCDVSSRAMPFRLFASSVPLQTVGQTNCSKFVSIIECVIKHLRVTFWQ